MNNIPFVNATLSNRGLPSNTVRVAEILADGQPHYVPAIAASLGTSERGVRARISDLRGRHFLITQENNFAVLHGIEV
jgi:hypothetical protein